MKDQNDSKGSTVTKSNDLTTPVRMKRITAKQIQAILSKLNKKQFGRKITPDDVISKALDLISNKQEVLIEIQNNCLSNADRIEIKYKEYCQQNGKISKDEFLGLLLQN